MTADPYRHLPDLAGRILDPARSSFRQIDFAGLDRKMAERGVTGWRRTDEEREATRQAALADRLDDDLWVFAYGSLMWDPAFHFAEVRRAQAEGYRRSFCLRTTLGRGTPEKPGLMAALDRGGNCHGLAFRIDRQLVDEETRVIWAREMIMHAYDPAFIALTTPQGPVEALAFLISPEAEHYLRDLSLEEAAGYIATGAGTFGTNLDYLDNLAEHFRVLDIDDEEFFALHALARQMAERPAEV